MRIANTPGTVDADYRDNVGILIDNLSDETIVIKAGDRIAQFVLHPVYRFKGVATEDVNQIGENRGGGFGSTGN
jgi:dUTP pyrophosphatase